MNPYQSPQCPGEPPPRELLLLTQYLLMVAFALAIIGLRLALPIGP